MGRNHISIFVMSLTIPVHTVSAPLPLNASISARSYVPLLMQRIKVQLSSEEVLLGSTNTSGLRPTRDIGPYIFLGSWFAWNKDYAGYEPSKMGFVSTSGKSGITLTADPLTAERSVNFPMPSTSTQT